jgi:hypothetical protein
LIFWFRRENFDKVVRRAHCATPHTPCRRTRYSIPLFIKSPRLGYLLQCHRNLNSGHSSVDAAAGGVRRRAVNSSMLVIGVVAVAIACAKHPAALSNQVVSMLSARTLKLNTLQPRTFSKTWNRQKKVLFWIFTMFWYGAIIALLLPVLLALFFYFPNMAPQQPLKSTGHIYATASGPRIHWYSLGKGRPDPTGLKKISNTFDVLVYLLPNY